MQPAFLGGLFIGILSALPIIQLCNCCCVWILGGGMLAAYLQQQNQPSPLTPINGARAGLLAGVVGAFVWLIAAQALDLVLAPLQERVMGEILRNARDMPPDVRTWFESMDTDRTAGYAFGFAIMLLFGSLAAAVGGAIGAAYFRTDVPPALGGPITPPPMP